MEFSSILMVTASLLLMTLTPCMIADLVSNDASTADTSSNTTDNSSSYVKWSSYRLPQNLKPEKYTIRLHPNISTSTFTGNISMTLKIQKVTDQIIFHANKLDLTTVTVTWREPMPVPTHPLIIAESGSLGRLQMYYIRLDRQLPVNFSLEVKVNFSGLIGSTTQGLHKNHYRVGAEERTMLSTQMQATHARQVFPCLDEPSFKAVFTMEIVRARGLFSLSNTDLVSTMDAPRYCEDCELDTFNPSPVMSSYLVALTISDFKNISSKTKSGKQIRIFADEYQIQNAECALNTTVKAFDFFQDFFDVDLPLNKYDVVAVSNHISGMENWGLIICVDSVVIVSNFMCSDTGNIHQLLAHEVAHQWFGNLVTIAWWDDIWLNEGFTKYVSTLAWSHLDDYVDETSEFSQYLSDALTHDSWMGSHALHHRVSTPSDIVGNFNEIPYTKGAVLLRILENILGQSILKRGLKKYLEDFKYKNVDHVDLWEKIQQVSGRSDLDVRSFMKAWVEQPGYPVVTVKRSGCSLHLTQERFVLANHSASDETIPWADLVWTFPFTYITQAKPNETIEIWITGKTQNHTMTPARENGTCDGWIVGNVNRTGLYRVNYEMENWKSLSELFQSNHTVFSTESRKGLLDDAFTLARAGYLSYNTAFGFLDYLPGGESKGGVWRLIDAHFQYIFKRLWREQEYRLMKSYTKSLQTVFSSRYDLYLTFGYKEDYGNWLDSSWKSFLLWKTEKTTLKGFESFESAKAGVIRGGREGFKFVLRQFLETGSPVYFVQLAYTPHEELLTSALEMCLNTNVVSANTAYYFIETMQYNNPNALLPFWVFLKRNWTQIVEPDSLATAYVFDGLKQFESSFAYKEISGDFYDKDVGGTRYSLDLAVEEVFANAFWKSKRMPEVKAFLVERMKQWTRNKENYYPFGVESL